MTSSGHGLFLRPIVPSVSRLSSVFVKPTLIFPIIALAHIVLTSKFITSGNFSCNFCYRSHLLFTLSATWSEHGGLGAGNNSHSAVCAVDARAVVPAACQRQSCGVWEHANQSCFHLCPLHHLLWPPHHFPYCNRCSYLHRIVQQPVYQNYHPSASPVSCVLISDDQNLQFLPLDFTSLRHPVRTKLDNLRYTNLQK